MEIGLMIEYKTFVLNIFVDLDLHHVLSFSDDNNNKLDLSN